MKRGSTLLRSRTISCEWQLYAAVRVDESWCWHDQTSDYDNDIGDDGNIDAEYETAVTADADGNDDDTAVDAVDESVFAFFVAGSPCVKWIDDDAVSIDACWWVDASDDNDDDDDIVALGTDDDAVDIDADDTCAVAIGLDDWKWQLVDWGIALDMNGDCCIAYWLWCGEVAK